MSWKQYIASVQYEEAANVVARTRTAKPAALPLSTAGQSADDGTTVLPPSLVLRSNMDKEKLRGMLDEWDELTTTCNDAVMAVCDKYGVTV